jgi:hypothetical protein
MKQFKKSGRRRDLEEIPSDKRYILNSGEAVVHVCG